ncbi:Abc transporter c family member 5, partial [Globisporangium splendens]
MSVPLLRQPASQRKSYNAISGTPNATKTPSSILSRLLFSHATPVMELGNTRQLNHEDLSPVDGETRAASASAAFEAQYNKHSSTTWALVHTYGGIFGLCGLARVFSAACALLAPLVLNYVVTAIGAPELDTTTLSIWLGCFFASRLANAIASAHANFYLEVAAMQITVALRTLLFKKAMRRSIQSKNDQQTVDMVNLFTTDMTSIQWAASQVNNLWILPFQIAVTIYMLYTMIGAAAFAGLAVIGGSMVVSFVFSKYMRDAFNEMMARKDDRMKVIKEVFAAIQIVKFNAWELKFFDKIASARARELACVKRVLYIGAGQVFALWASPVLVSSASFAVYTLVMHQTLTAAKVFTAIALFNALRDPLRDMPGVIEACIHAKVSLDRMAQFLHVSERDPDSICRDGASQPSDVAVDITEASFGWSREVALLKNVNTTVKKGDLVVVCGSVGGGKSSLCAALLGEMEKLSGSVFVRGRVAYYSQQPWIQNMTIRDNILFGNHFDRQKYEAVIDACGLRTDLAQFPGGDLTEIGEKGINLSGGQNARVSLARACYSDADVFILDSPLAAVDTVVQSEIFSKCICGLLGKKTIVLVTHSVSIIDSAAVNCKILVENGEVQVERRSITTDRTRYAALASSPASDSGNHAHKLEHEDAEKLLVGRLVSEEAREDGRVAGYVFLEYFHALGGISVCLVVLIVQALWQGFQISSGLWLSHWTGEEVSSNHVDTTNYNMQVYALLGAGSVLMVLLRVLTISIVGLRASRYLFNGMTRSLLRAPLRFFDTNPIGRLLSRYSDDFTAVDIYIPFAYGGLLGTAFSTICQLATAMYMVNFLGVLVVPLVYLYAKVGKFYLAPSREVSRLRKVVMAPVLGHATQCERGVVTIRAFGSQYVQHLVSVAHNLTDRDTTVWLAEATTNQWFQVRMQLLGCGMLIVIVSALVSLHDYLSPGLVGLVFTYALSVDSGLSTVVRTWSRMEILMVSPERILEYVSVPPEGSQKPLTIEPPTQWPRQGTITFDNVVFSYKEGAPAVLKGLSFDIKSNEKIGIVGRTGAGKSSLTMALFRINELGAGRILIDGEDISTMPLRSLRSKLSIIPQSPVLFKGTLRAYMDPFDEFTDAEIWSAFEKVEMKEQIGALENQLSYELSENGENFSVGERQMLCMARALLTQTRIVVMDEATASIDHATEKKLQTMIDRDFKDATVLTIAHRLATVLDSDRIMVLSDGNVVEFDSANNLVQNPKGVFYELAREGGYLDQLL